MKFAVIGYPESINAGDEIQSIAAAHLLPRVDYYLPREALDQVDNLEEIKLICNGYFMYQPEHWPPAPCIRPLFISMHAARSLGADGYLANARLKDYYGQYGSVGCRDLTTLSLFREQGIESYFSGCLTLTLGDLFREETRSQEILFVDPFVNEVGREYSKKVINEIVPKDLLENVELITHMRPGTDLSIKERNTSALRLLRRYATAKLVITSRLHCALPCLAFGTPVCFLDFGYSEKYGKDRFGGLTDLLYCISDRRFPFLDGNLLSRVIRKSIPVTHIPWKKIFSNVDWYTPEPNSADIGPLVEEMKSTVYSFVNES